MNSIRGEDEASHNRRSNVKKGSRIRSMEGEEGVVNIDGFNWGEDEAVIVNLIMGFIN